MLVRLERMLLRIILVLRGDVAGNRTSEMDNVAGSKERGLKGGKAGLRKERKQRAHLKKNINYPTFPSKNSQTSN